MNIFIKHLEALKQLLIFQPSTTPPPFVLQEAEQPKDKATKTQLSIAAEQHEALLRYARRVTVALKKAQRAMTRPFPEETIISIKAELNALEHENQLLSPIIQTYSLNQDPKDQAVSTCVEENMRALQCIYNFPDNKDLVIRSVVITVSQPITAQIAYIDGLVDRKMISLAILQPLMRIGNQDRQIDQQDVLNQLVTRYLPSNQIKLAHTLHDVTDSLNMGDSAIFLDGLASAVIVETKGQEHRAVDRPAIEQSVRGSQSAFTETLRVNTGLVRSILRTSDLTSEIVTIGLRSNTSCAFMYLKSVINPTLVTEVKRRLTNIKIDILAESGTLEQFIEDSPMIPYPQTLSTERPDRVAAALSEGRLAILVDGSPFALVLPVSLFTLFHSSEDFSYSSISASVTRILRILAAALTLLLPSSYIAISYFHPEALPTDLLLAIGGAREKVPFPSILEIALMEFAFELLREAGVRIPGMLGNTIGIVGAIILGQAAVAASIVSPITVMIIAVTGLASFAIPDNNLAIAIRLTRFALEAFAAMFGLVGVAMGLLATTVLLCSLKSLGVPYLSPIGPKTKAGFDIVLRGPMHSQELRPDELSPQDERRQTSYSRQWKAKPLKGDEETS